MDPRPLNELGLLAALLGLSQMTSTDDQYVTRALYDLTSWLAEHEPDAYNHANEVFVEKLGGILRG